MLRIARIAAVATIMALGLHGSATAQEICLFEPPDGEICFTCDSPPNARARAECASRCEDPVFRLLNSSCEDMNPTCGPREELIDGRCVERCAFDEERIRGQCRERCLPGEDRINGRCTQQCDADEDRVGDMCLMRCEADERRLGDQCVARECPAGQKIVRGQCVDERRANCVPARVPQRIAALTERTAQRTDQRFAVVIALAIAGQIPVELRDGRTVTADPQSPEGDASALRESVQAFARAQGVRCEVTRTRVEPGACAQALLRISDRLKKQIEPAFLRVKKIGIPFLGPEADQCFAAGDRITMEFFATIGAARELQDLYDVQEDIAKGVAGEPDRIRVACDRPSDLGSCRIRATRKGNQDDMMAKR